MIPVPRDEARRLARSAIRGEFQPEALHAYTDENGEAIYWRIRARLADGGKWIRPMRRSGDTCELGEPEFPLGKPLYRLHELAGKPNAPCWYVEGENCADTLAKLGLLATTAGGATSDERADFRPLAGRAVTIWPDNDAAGIGHAERVAAKLRALGCAIERIDVRALGLPVGGDVVDWLRANPGATAANLTTVPRVREKTESRQEAPAAYRQERNEWPEPLNDAAFYGLVGEIVREIEPQTEADPAALLVQVLVAFGALVGRGPHVRVEGDEHHGNLFALLVGETAKARKGTSWGRVREVFSRAEDWPNVVTGLSSGEGLKWAVRDPIRRIERDKKTRNAVEVETDAGVRDKRLLVVEAEFAQVLRQAARAGNTLSATIRSAWDTGRLSTLTKNDTVTATGAHISIIGHITADELRAELTATDSANGFANRFLFKCARRSKVLAFGGQAIPKATVSRFAERIARAVGKARERGAVEFTDAARQTWATVYPTLSEGHPSLLGAVTARAEAQCLRMALVFALMDEAEAIDQPHLFAAIAVWERAEASARYIFGSALGDPVADDILRALRVAGSAGMTRTAIRDLFKRHQSAERIGAALELLRRRGFVKCDTRPADGGRPSEVWQCV
ncbi:MAG: DUF3987 domain-containing protein [Burkholderiales bacterium]|nr:DUF3987 domain-containing protein [Burkholderiales bacterium]